MRSSGRRLSRSAPTSPTRPRSGSTAMSGPSARPPGLGSGSPSCPTGSPPPTTPPGCRPSATAWYWWEISMRQVEVSRTIVFTQPRHARGFFEALVADNLDIGRPDQIELIFAGRRVRPGRSPATPEVFKTKVVTRGVDVTVNAFYQHSRIKQYLKDPDAAGGALAGR